MPELPADILPRPIAKSEPTPGSPPPVEFVPRPPRVYKRPRTTPLVVWALAVVGAGAVFAIVTKRVRHLFESPPALSRVLARGAKAPQWHPVAAGQDEVLIYVEANPRQAQILVDGQPASSNPLLLPRADQMHEITVRADGYVEKTVRQSARAPGRVAVTLEKQKLAR